MALYTIIHGYLQELFMGKCRLRENFKSIDCTGTIEGAENKTAKSSNFNLLGCYLGKKSETGVKCIIASGGWTPVKLRLQTGLPLVKYYCEQKVKSLLFPPPYANANANEIVHYSIFYQIK